MKVKTSVTLDKGLLDQVDESLPQYKNRSLLVEEAIRYFLKQKLKEMREEKDFLLLNKNSAQLNQEAKDVLTYQIPL